MRHNFAYRDKGKMPVQFCIIADDNRQNDLELLSSPNPRALVPSANFAPIGRVKGVSLNTDGIANTTSVSKGTNKIPSREADSLCSAKYLRRKAESKALFHAKSEVTMTSFPKSSDAKFAPDDGATRITPPSEVNITNEVIFESPKDRSLKARGLQPEQSNTQSLQVSKQYWVSLVNTDLREFLTNKQKLELLHTSLSPVVNK